MCASKFGGAHELQVCKYVFYANRLLIMPPFLVLHTNTHVEASSLKAVESHRILANTHIVNPPFSEID